MHDAMVQAAAYVLTARPHHGQVSFRRLIDKPDKASDVTMVLADTPFVRRPEDFASIPGSPAAYWLSPNECSRFFKRETAGSRSSKHRMCEWGSQRLGRLPIRPTLVGDPCGSDRSRTTLGALRQGGGVLTVLFGSTPCCRLGRQRKKAPKLCAIKRR